MLRRFSLFKLLLLLFSLNGRCLFFLLWLNSLSIFWSSKLNSKSAKESECTATIVGKRDKKLTVSRFYK